MTKRLDRIRELEQELARCRRDYEHIHSLTRTEFDEWLLAQLEAQINDLIGKVEAIEAAERVGRVLHEE